MAMGLYRGVNNVARKVTKMYRGVNNVARTVTKGYRGVSNVARQFFSSRVYLYNNGDKCTDITGGWTFIKYSQSNYPTSNASIIYNSNNIVLEAKNTGFNVNGQGTFYTTNKINLTNFSKLRMKLTSDVVTGTDDSLANALLAVFNQVPTTSGMETSWHKTAGLKGVSLATIDITSLSGAYNLGVWVYDALVDYGTSKITIHEIWLEE